MSVTKEMIGEAHDICLKKGDFVLSANLLERIYLAMRDKAKGNDSAGWDAYEDLRKASDEKFIEMQARIAELEKDAARLDWLADVNNTIGNVQLPTECVLAAMNLRDAIDLAMKLKLPEPFCQVAGSKI